MSRSPLIAVAVVLAAGLLVAACGAAPAAHGRAPKGAPSASATAKPTSAVVAAEAGFRAWAEALVLLSGPMPASSSPAAEADVRLLGTAYDPPSLGVLQALGHGLVLNETPPGCMASWNHVLGAFGVPPGAPATVPPASGIALVVRQSGACTTSAGGITYIQNPASGPGSVGTWVLLGNFVTLSRVPGLPTLAGRVWAPSFVATCQSGWVQAAGGSGSFAAAVPGC